ncbi:hypothetical protein APSETT444_003068 [Aspergillus pseudonomiae]
MTAQAYLERYKQLTSIEDIKNNLIEDREPFIVVLLDGGGIIFKDEYLQQGEQGGQNAAKKLHSALQDYVSGNFPTINSPKVITKMYVNVKGLSDLCVRGGVTTEPSLIEDFVRGFNASYPLFDLVDIGPGKESAHDKIGDTLADRDLIGRVSLIEGLPFASDLDLIKTSYRVTKISDLFRDTKISVWAPWKAAVASKPRALLTPSPVQHVTLSRTSTNTTTTSNSVPISTSSTNTPNSGEFQVVRSKSSVPPPPKIVERNKYGQRVDRLDFKTIPRDEANALMKTAITIIRGN